MGLELLGKRHKQPKQLLARVASWQLALGDCESPPRNMRRHALTRTRCDPVRYDLSGRPESHGGLYDIRTPVAREEASFNGSSGVALMGGI